MFRGQFDLRHYGGRLTKLKRSLLDSDSLSENPIYLDAFSTHFWRPLTLHTSLVTLRTRSLTDEDLALQRSCWL